MKLNPKAKKSTPQRQVSTMHSMRTFTVSRERQKPASSIVKPTCIANTRNAARSVHTVLIGFTMSVAFTSPSAANALRPIKSGRKATAAISKATLSPFPIKSNPPYRRHSGSRSRTPNRDIFCESVSLFFISICECLLKLVSCLCDTRLRLRSFCPYPGIQVSCDRLQRWRSSFTPAARLALSQPSCLSVPVKVKTEFLSLDKTNDGSRYFEACKLQSPCQQAVDCRKFSIVQVRAIDIDSKRSGRLSGDEARWAVRSVP